MSPTTTDAALAYYASIGAALFPVPAGQKNPTGIVSSFVTDCSTDPSAWAAWRSAHPNCNFGIVAGASGVVILDIDAAEFGRDEAWTAYTKLCTDDWGLPAPPMPMVQSARGGWHVLFRVPAGVDPRSLRQPDARKGIINVRAGNGFVIAAGSTFEGKPYSLISDAAPHPAPAKLIEHCTRREGGTVTKVGDYDPADVAALLTWMSSKGMFDSYEDWIGCGMCLRTEFGDAGLDLWRKTFIDDGKDKNEASHWQSFATDPRAGLVTLNTLFDRAHKEKWTGNVRRTSDAMFADVISGAHSQKTIADLAAQVGAKLPSEAMESTPENEMFGRDKKQAAVGGPILERFMTAHVSAPSRPSFSNYRLLPKECDSKILYAAVNEVIPRLLAVCESGKGRGSGFDKELIKDVFAVLCMTSKAAGLLVLSRARQDDVGFKLTDKVVLQRMQGLINEAEDGLINKNDFIRDDRMKADVNNSDNLAIFYGMVRLEIRYNNWIEAVEVRGGDPAWKLKSWTKWTDKIEKRIRSHAKKTSFGYNMSKDFHFDTAEALADENTVDPAVEYVAACEKEWDGVPRLDSWLHFSCGVPDDAYHQMVGRSIVGGMVKRIRHAGAKHDEMAVLIGDQGHGKSTLARAICPDPDWFSEGVRLGDEAKDLIPKLRGKAVCEISEMTSRKQVEDVKAMLSTQVDSTVLRYGRASTDRPRRNIFIGSTNSTTPLQDDTGNRRFLPVRIERPIDLEWIKANQRMLIGEAAVLESQGETFAVPRDLWAVAAEHQESARQKDSEEIIFADWFAQQPGFDTSFIMPADLEKLALVAGFKSPKSRGQVMRKLGFRSDTARLFGAVKKVWIRGADLTGKGLESHSVQFVVDVSSERFPRVVVRLPAAPPSTVGQGGPPMPPTVPPLPMVPPRS